MSDEWSTKLCGEVISYFSVVKYVSLGIQQIVIHLSSGVNIGIDAREVKLGADETYTLDVDQSVAHEGTHRKIQVGVLAIFT